MSNLQSHQTSPTEADIAAAKNAWNAVADEFNQWDNLSVDEQEKWQGSFAAHADAQFPALARLRSALKDDPEDIAAGVPEDAIEAGIDAWKAANRDMANYVSGETTDWDEGMIVAAIFKAVARSILASPAKHVDDVELLADVFDSTDPRAHGVLPFPRTDFGEKSGDAMIAECIAYGRQSTDPKEDPDADSKHALFAIKVGRALSEMEAR